MMAEHFIIPTVRCGGLVDARPRQAEPPNAASPALARRFARGDDDAFDCVARQFAPRVAALARRLLDHQDDPDDVVQDVFLAAYGRRHTFRAEAELWTWLARITVNRCRTLIRRRRLWKRFQQFWGRAGESSAPRAMDEAPPDAGALASERAVAVRRAVDRLPPRLKEAIILVYLEQLAIPAAAEILDIKRGALDARLTRARAELKRHLADWHDGD